MNVRGPLLHRLEEHEIHVAHNGCRIGFGFQAAGLAHIGQLQIGKDVLCAFVLGCVAGIDQLLDPVLIGDHHNDILADGKPEILDGLGIQGFHERHVQSLLIKGYRQGTMHFRQRCRHQIENGPGWFIAAQIGKFRPQFLGNDFINLLLVLHKSKVEKQTLHILTGGGNFIENLVKLMIIESPAALKQIENVSGSHGGKEKIVRKMSGIEKPLHRRRPPRFPEACGEPYGQEDSAGIGLATCRGG